MCTSSSPKRISLSPWTARWKRLPFCISGAPKRPFVVFVRLVVRASNVDRHDTGSYEQEMSTHTTFFSFYTLVLGVMPWYRPRSNPDGVGITIQCVDWTDGGTKEKPDIDIKVFEGTDWEGTMKRINTAITGQSKA